MSIGLKSNVSGTSGAIQIGGADIVTVDNTGIVTSIASPAQFDNTTKLATTEFVNQTVGSFSGFLSINTATTLTTTAFSKVVSLSTGPYTVTLPAANSGTSGSAITFANVGGSSSVITLTCAGADTIHAGDTSGVTSIVLQSGDNITLVTNGTSSWWAISGSAQLAYSGAFASSITSGSPGYQKLPGGLIIQWASVVSGASADVGWTYPIAFPTAAINVQGTTVQGTGTLSRFATIGAISNTSANFGVYTDAGVRVAASTFLLALGY